MKTMVRLWWIGVLGILIVGLLSCQIFERAQKSPTTPEHGDAAQFANFFTNPAVSDQFVWGSGHEVFCVNVPIIGDYALKYTTLLGTFYIVFRAYDPAYMYVGLTEGDILQQVALYAGAIKPGAAPVREDNRVSRYATPTVPVDWRDVFTPGRMMKIVQGTEECRVITSTKKALAAQSLATGVPAPEGQVLSAKKQSKMPPQLEKWWQERLEKMKQRRAKIQEKIKQRQDSQQPDQPTHED